MGILSDLLGKPDPLVQKAAQLPSLARILASTLSTPPSVVLASSERISRAIAEDGADNWDFFVTVAVVCLALIRLRKRVRRARFVHLSELPFDTSFSVPQSKPDKPESAVKAAINWALDERRTRWYRDGRAAVNECLEYLNHAFAGMVDHPALVASSVGFWLVWNVLWSCLSARTPKSPKALAKCWLPPSRTSGIRRQMLTMAPRAHQRPPSTNSLLSPEETRD